MTLPMKKQSKANVAAFLKRKPPGPPRFNSPHMQATYKPGQIRGGDQVTEDSPGWKPKRGGNRITEDDPRWNPRTMGNKRGNSAGYYRKGSGRPD